VTRRRTIVALAALAMVAVGCEGPRSEAPSSGPQARDGAQALFLEVAAESGLRFQHFTGATGEYYFPEIVGPGAALLDYDRDGDLDVYVVQGSVLDPGSSEKALFPLPAGSPPGNRLFANQLVPKGELRFVDVTERAGVGDTGHGMGVAVGDFDNDGYPDLYVTNFGPNVLYRNRGDGTFADVTRGSGTQEPGWSTSAAFVDADRDGRLDLFVTRYVDFALDRNKLCRGSADRREYCGPKVYDPLPDRLYRNEGGGRFSDVTAAAGLEASFGSGLGVTVLDADDDGWPDLYVANDQLPNQLWINRGDGTFEDRGPLSGSAYNLEGKAESSMGVAAGDFDGDGDEDLFMTHLAGETNTLYVNDGGGQFLDSTDRFNLGVASLPFTGFGTAWLDYDNDGRLDLFVTNGAVDAEETQLGREAYPYRQTDQLFRQEPDGRFTEVSERAGPSLAAPEVGRGAAFGDLDNDGDIDIVVSNNNGPLWLLRNEVGHRNHWLMVELDGERSNRAGIGAEVTLLRPAGSFLRRRARTDGSYLSANDVRVHFGLARDPDIEGVAVEWPSGLREIWSGVEANRVVRLVEGSGKPWNDPLGAAGADDPAASGLQPGRP